MNLYQVEIPQPINNNYLSPKSLSHCNILLAVGWYKFPTSDIKVFPKECFQHQEDILLYVTAKPLVKRTSHSFLLVKGSWFCTVILQYTKGKK